MDKIQKSEEGNTQISQDIQSEQKANQNTKLAEEQKIESLENEDLDKYSKEEIIKKYLFIKKENQVLRKQLNHNNDIKVNVTQNNSFNDSKKQKKEQKQNNKKENLFEIYQQQHYALKMSYVGINYQGLAYQQETENTVEEQLFKALEKTTLIKNRDNCNFTRSGRTDKGVSALGQVIGISLRTSVKIGENIDETENKLDYIKMLNSNLPDDIRILSCSKVESTFNARFDCQKRIYKYYFFENQMDTQRMKDAANLFLGEHDFRNFCKIDVLQTINYVRIIYQLDIEEVQSNFGTLDPRSKLYVATIQGSAFLWHQIRNMMAILFLVGKKQEDPSIVTELLDIQKNPSKPNYEMAPDYPLVLFDCLYNNVSFNYSGDQIKIYDHYLQIIQKKCIENQLYITTLNYLASNAQQFNNYNLIQNSLTSEEATLRNKKYQHLSKRQCAQSSEDTLKNLKGRKLDKFLIKQEKQINYQQKSEVEKNQLGSQDQSSEAKDIQE
ncbi:hypothetical protein ABPG72_022719 [Tetrahymena utriculariae]